MKSLFLLGILLAVPVLSVIAGNKYVSFKQGPAGYSPKEYYIGSVTDSRLDKNNDGTIRTGNGKNDVVQFKDGLAPALDEYIRGNVSQNNTEQNIVLHIMVLKVNIKRNGLFLHTDLSVKFGFYAAGKEVITYTNSAEGTTNKDPGNFLEKFIRESLATDLKEFDTWWPEHRSKVATDPTVKVNVTIGKTIDEPGCIIYSLQKPLLIADFKGTPTGQNDELAATFSGIGLFYTADAEDGHMVLNVTVTPYFSTTKSFFKEQGKNARVLAHEQAHFDITAIRTCKMANIIRNTVFTQENYKDVLEQLRQQNMNELEAEEAKYDEETSHGRIQDKQIEWQTKVKDEVKTIGCY